MAGKAHCAKPILRAKNVGLVGQVGLVRTLLRRRLRRAGGTGCSVCHVPRKFHSTWLCVLFVGKVLCAERMESAENVGLGCVGRRYWNDPKTA